MALATLNGDMLTSARVIIPRTGAWLFDGSTSEPVALEPGGRVSLTLGDDMAMSGTVIRAPEFEGRTQFRAVGGGGGWTAPVAPRGYTSAAGLRFAAIAQDAARDAGESVGPSAPQTSVGTKYSRLAGPASQVLALLAAGVEWWIDDAGVTQFGQRPGGVITAAFQTMDFDGRSGMLTIATDSPGAFRPGKTVSAPNIGSREISGIVWIVTTDSLRGELWIG